MYAQRYVESDVLSQDPVELVRMLYSKALEKLGQAEAHLAAGRIEGRASAIAHASEIVLELQASLDYEKGGEIAKDLSRIYDYIQEKLAEANGQQTLEPLEESARLLSTLYEGWKDCRSAESASELAVELELETASASNSGRAWTL